MINRFNNIETKTQELTMLLSTVTAFLVMAAGCIYLFATPDKLTQLTGAIGSITLEKIFNGLGYGSFYLGLSCLWFGQFSINKIINPADIQKYYSKFIFFFISQAIIITLIASYLSIFQALFHFSSHQTMLFGAGGLFGLKIGGGLFSLFGAFGSIALLTVFSFVLLISTGLFRFSDAGRFLSRCIAVSYMSIKNFVSTFFSYTFNKIQGLLENNMIAQKIFFKFNKFLPKKSASPSQYSNIELNEFDDTVDLNPVEIEAITSEDAPKGLISYYPEISLERANTAKERASQSEVSSKVKRKTTQVRPKKIESLAEEKSITDINIKAWTKKYIKPEIQLLDKPTKSVNMTKTELEQGKSQLMEHLESFGIFGSIIDVHEGPTLAMYELQLKAGVKLSKIASLNDDLAMALGAPSIRILAPIPGKTTIGIEIPTKKKRVVNLSELMSTTVKDKDLNLPIPMGMNVNNETIISDLTKMPHMLVSGTTGSGKSVFINTLISSLIFNKSPKELRFLMVDPKMIELSPYNGIPHLLKPVVTDVNEAKGILQWAEKEMDRRYKLLAQVGSKDITSFNAFIKSEKKTTFVKKNPTATAFEWAPLPYLVIIIDELADLMMTQGKEVEIPITRIAQKARACGIHMVIATQRPSSDIITGLIKTNFPTRVACKVSSSIDSRTILDTAGAEKLFGYGDLLFLPNGKAIQRLQSAYISEGEVKKLVKQAKKSL